MTEETNRVPSKPKRIRGPRRHVTRNYGGLVITRKEMVTKQVEVETVVLVPGRKMNNLDELTPLTEELTPLESVMDEIVEVQKKKKVITKRPPRTVKERKFVREYIRTGSAIQAVKNVYDTKDSNNAAKLASKMSAKIDITSMLDRRGLSDEKLVEFLREGIEKPITSDGRSDYSTRHKYLETAFKLKGYWGDRMKLAMEQDGDKVRILLDLPADL